MSECISLVCKISKFNSIKHPFGMFTDSWGSRIQSGHIPGEWAPKCLGQEGWSERVESTEGSLTRFAGSWCWLLSKTYLPVASPCSLVFLTVSDWVPGVSTAGRREALLLSWAQRLQSNTFSIVRWLQQSQAHPGLRETEINCTLERKWQ